MERQIPGTPYRDAMGCYPLFTCKDWSKLAEDVQELEGDLVSLALVTDPFGEFNPTSLEGIFKDRVIPFKEHFIVDLNQSITDFVCAHHRRNVKKAQEKITVEVCEEPMDWIDKWVELYSNLIVRHNIKGLTGFSVSTFIRQFQVPGIVVFRADYMGKPVGLLIWYTQNNIGYYHLSAIDDLGYASGASFALFWYSIEYFSGSLRWLDLGAGQGVIVMGDGKDGLSRFKRGWSTGTRTVYFCGRILNKVRYEEIIQVKGIADSNYFPSYRAGEFG